MFQKDPDDYITAANELWNSDPELSKTSFIYWDKLEKFEMILTAERSSATRISDDSESGLLAQKKAKEVQKLSAMKQQIIGDVKKEVMKSVSNIKGNF